MMLTSRLSVFLFPNICKRIDEAKYYESELALFSLQPSMYTTCVQAAIFGLASQYQTLHAVVVLDLIVDNI